MDFKQLVLNENNSLTKISEQEKAATFELSKQYVFLQDLLEELRTLLAKDETILGYLPLTPDGNLAFANQGLGAYAYATTEKAKAYRDIFHDTRGNRLLVFTETRMLFLVIIDYLESNTYFSYPYETIKAFTIKPRKLMKHESPEDKEQFHWGYFDFQAGTHIFSEVLTKKDYELFTSYHESIPALKKIPIQNKVYRAAKYQYFLSNWHFSFRLMTAFNLLFLLLFVLMILGFFLRIGPLKGFYYKDLLDIGIVISLFYSKNILP